MIGDRNLYLLNVRNLIVTGLQRIWMLCLLVIAGSGPLPLWLHDVVCHNSACASHACPSQAASSHNQPARCCEHPHADRAFGMVKSQSQPANWKAVADSHEDCVVCYTLSQLTTASPIQAGLIGHLFSHAVAQAGDSQASLDHWLAYSPRGPPACV